MWRSLSYLIPISCRMSFQGHKDIFTNLMKAIYRLTHTKWIHPTKLYAVQKCLNIMYPAGNSFSLGNYFHGIKTGDFQEPCPFSCIISVTAHLIRLPSYLAQEIEESSEQFRCEVNRRAKWVLMMDLDKPKTIPGEGVRVC